ncbi:hypothetical protein SCODD09_01006 [Streptococcus constellatus]|nr:hypothetical protein SCODD09_01006 [Streptococcus constellatus]
MNHSSFGEWFYLAILTSCLASKTSYPKIRDFLKNEEYDKLIKSIGGTL